MNERAVPSAELMPPCGSMSTSLGRAAARQSLARSSRRRSSTTPTSIGCWRSVIQIAQRHAEIVFANEVLGRSTKASLVLAARARPESGAPSHRSGPARQPRGAGLARQTRRPRPAHRAARSPGFRCRSARPARGRAIRSAGCSQSRSETRSTRCASEIRRVRTPSRRTPRPERATRADAGSRRWTVSHAHGTRNGPLGLVRHYAPYGRGAGARSARPRHGVHRRTRAPAPLAYPSVLHCCSGEKHRYLARGPASIYKNRGSTWELSNTARATVAQRRDATDAAAGARGGVRAAAERPGGRRYRADGMWPPSTASQPRPEWCDLRRGVMPYAAVASALAVGVVNPSSCGIGGGGFMLIYDRAQRASVPRLSRASAGGGHA